MSRIGFCKHDAEKYISTLRLTNLITDIEHYMTRFMQVADYSQLSEIQNVKIKLNIGRLEEKRTVEWYFWKYCSKKSNRNIEKRGISHESE